MAVKKKPALGRSLASLLGGDALEKSAGPVAEDFPLAKLTPNPNQPRRNFDDQALEELAQSIAVHGLLQPLLVRRCDGKVMIVAGERRYRAAIKAGLTTVPVRFVEADHRQLREMALVENLQREDLSPLELAQALRELLDHYDVTQEELGRHLGWSRSAVSNKLRLLTLPEPVQRHLADGTISEGHARALISLEDPQEIQRLLEECLRFSWSVRTLEKRIKGLQSRSETAKTKAKAQRWRPQGALKVSRRLGISLSVLGQGDNNKMVLKGLSRDQVNALCDLMIREAQALKRPGSDGP